MATILHKTDTHVVGIDTMWDLHPNGDLIFAFNYVYDLDLEKDIDIIGAGADNEFLTPEDAEKAALEYIEAVYTN